MFWRRNRLKSSRSTSRFQKHCPFWRAIRQLSCFLQGKFFPCLESTRWANKIHGRLSLGLKPSDPSPAKSLMPGIFVDSAVEAANAFRNDVEVVAPGKLSGELVSGCDHRGHCVRFFWFKDLWNIFLFLTSPGRSDTKGAQRKGQRGETRAQTVEDPWQSTVRSRKTWEKHLGKPKVNAENFTKYKTNTATPFSLFSSLENDILREILLSRELPEQISPEKPWLFVRHTHALIQKLENFLEDANHYNFSWNCQVLSWRLLGTNIQTKSSLLLVTKKGSCNLSCWLESADAQYEGNWSNTLSRAPKQGSHPKITK